MACVIVSQNEEDMNFITYLLFFSSNQIHVYIQHKVLKALIFLKITLLYPSLHWSYQIVHESTSGSSGWEKVPHNTSEPLSNTKYPGPNNRDQIWMEAPSQNNKRDYKIKRKPVKKISKISWMPLGWKPWLVPQW